MFSSTLLISCTVSFVQWLSSSVLGRVIVYRSDILKKKSNWFNRVWVGLGSDSKHQSSNSVINQGVSTEAWRKTFSKTYVIQLTNSITPWTQVNDMIKEHVNTWTDKDQSSLYYGCQNMVEFLHFLDFNQISNSKHHILPCYLRSISHAAGSMV